MNTITQIENALKAINQASFQILVNHLLYLQGNKFIGAPGAVVGKEKTSKGTPDSFFVNEEKYIFVECTTQERLGESKSFFEKLSKDIDHCFKEDVTTIEKEKIEKVILACNEKVSAEDHKLLNTKVKSYNPDTKFEVLNVQNLPLLIFDIPKLAQEYLNIQIVKGDIHTLEEFLLKTEKGLQPSLTNEFIGREEELKNSLDALKQYDILLLSGGAGVGKSKLAVKILEELSKDNYVPIVIQSSGVSLWDDYQHLFLSGKQHIVLFDDANKSITNLNYLLNRIQASQSYSVKVIVTSRDYVKKQVSFTLNDYLYKEINVPEFKNEEVGKIIVAALPNLQYYSDIKRKIVDLAKGNARVALMATYSVTSDSETNYLSSPVLLYERYFEKISDEIGIFNNPIILKSLAIVSFFGVLDRNNEELETILSEKFDTDWNELWTAIMELHNNEIVDVYSNEIVKVSDQVLATYAFYKCFIDNKSSIINYGEWIITFIEKFSFRMGNSLKDVNNTFGYHHVKELVLPHLNEVVKIIKPDEGLYSFYDLFWFYKGRDCLLYLKKWINALPPEAYSGKLDFSYVHNAHTKATKYFELLKLFWSHSNELLKPSLELTLTLVVKQPSRLPEILKFLHSDFQYKLEDREHGYLRQHMLLDVLLDNDLTDDLKPFADGIFLKMAGGFMGWHFTEFASGRGRAFNFYNFDLYKSDELLRLRERILNQLFFLFDPASEQVQELLYQIIYPMGDIDKSVFVDELTYYQKLISEKLDTKQYAHCKFVSVLAQNISEVGAVYPENWNEFIESDIRKLSKFLKFDWEYKKGKSTRELEEEKRREFDDFVKINDWQSLEKFLMNVDTLSQQKKNDDNWQLESAITDIYFSIARKDKSEFENALRLFFSGKVLFPLRANVIYVALSEDIMTGKEFLNIMKDYNFKLKPSWELFLLTALPERQIIEPFLELLISNLKNNDEHFYINRMLDYLKYESAFDTYKIGRLEYENHNIITYITSIIQTKTSRKHPPFGFDFFSDCSSFFTEHIELLKNAFWYACEVYPDFDHSGEQLKAVLELDRSFVNESLKNGIIGVKYYDKIRLEKLNISALWECEEYQDLIEDLLIAALDKEEFTFIIEDEIYSIFEFDNNMHETTQKAKSLIVKLTQKYVGNEKIVLMLIQVVNHNFRDWFVEYFREFLLVNKEIQFTKDINFERSASWTGSKVPVIQRRIDFYQEIIKMINTLPNILDYSEHIDYFEENIVWKKREIEREQKKDFMDEYY